ADCARNLPLIVLMNALADLTAKEASALDVSIRAKHRLKNCHYHRQLFEAISRHDGEAAYTIMVEHIGDIQGRVRRSLAKGRPARAAAPVNGSMAGSTRLVSIASARTKALLCP